MRTKKCIQRSPRGFSRLAMWTLFLWFAGFSFSAHAQTIPNTPTNLLANAVFVGQINLTWSDTSTNEDGFKVERATSPGGPWTQIAQVLPDTTTYRNTGLFPYTTYYYRVCAFTGMFNSDYSSISSAVPGNSSPTSVVGWGLNSDGEATPPAGLTGVVAIAAGYTDGLALKSDGTVVGWGFGATTPPVGLTNAVAVAAGGAHSLALRSDGTVVGWGGGTAATPPLGLTGVVAIAAGNSHSLALKSDGTVVGWGDNTYGQATSPEGLTGVVAIAGGYQHSVALKGDGTVVCWGRNNVGQSSAPGGLQGVVAVSAGSAHSMALKSDGTVVGWGYGYGAETYPPPELSGVVGIAAGYTVSLALESDGTIVAWGYNESGQASPPSGLNRRLAVAAGYAHCLAMVRVISAPSNLTAAYVPTTRYDLSWTDNSADEDGFKIERAPDSGSIPGTWTQIATVSSNITTYSDTTVSANTKYWYRVRAYQSSDSSGYSNQASAILPVVCPRAVVGWGDSSNGKTSPPAGLEWAIAIAAADTHSLALKTDGTVVGWGNSFYATPPAGLSNVVAISARYNHSLVLKGDGSVTNWGYGPPPPPAGLKNVIAIAAGAYQDLALKADGTVTNWGYGTMSPPAGLSNVVAIAAGNYDNLALKSDGSVVSWGGSTPPSGLTNMVAIAAGNYHNLALKTNGTVVGWGSGSGATPPAGLSNVVAISAGNFFSLALKSDGTIVGWGENYYGQATPPAGLSNVVAIAAGGYHSLALTLPCSLSAPSALTATAVSASQINLAWLDNSPDESGFKIERSTDGTNFTQIAQVLPNTTSYRNTGLWSGTTYYYRVRPYNSGGDGDSSNVASAGTPAQCLSSIVNWSAGPPPLPDLTNVVAIAAGWLSFDLVLKSDGTVVHWGGSPTPPPGLSNVVAIATGHSYGLALKSDSTIVGWGFPPTATLPAGLSNVVAIAAGYSHSLALKSDGTVVGWGINSTGETNVPVGLSGVVGIAAGSYYSLALKSDGTVVGWGRNDYSQATPPSFLRAVTAISAGGNHSLAITSYGTVVGWGNNVYGKTNVPAGLSGVVAIGAGLDHSVALKSNGTVVAWGNNSAGQTNVPAGLSGVVAIGAGSYHSLAMSCAPYAPSTLVATTITKSQINLSWTDNSINENRFGIERAASSTGPWTEIGSVDFDVTTYPDTGLSCGQTYYYRVRAYDAAGGSPYSSIATANTSPDDLDCDGIADSWMQQYFGHPYGQASDNSRATDDADGDGQNNLAEFQAGTDPTNSASAFRILEIAPLDEDMLLTWSAVGGKWYIVQTATNLTGSLSNSFYDLNPVILAPGTNEYPLSVIHVGAATNSPSRFYRIRLAP